MPTDTERLDWFREYVMELSASVSGWYINGSMYFGTLREAIDTAMEASDAE